MSASFAAPRNKRKGALGFISNRCHVPWVSLGALNQAKVLRLLACLPPSIETISIKLSLSMSPASIQLRPETLPLAISLGDLNETSNAFAVETKKASKKMVSNSIICILYLLEYSFILLNSYCNCDDWAVVKNSTSKSHYPYISKKRESLVKEFISRIEGLAIIVSPTVHYFNRSLRELIFYVFWLNSKYRSKYVIFFVFLFMA